MANEYSHRNLIVWQRAQALAHDLIKLKTQTCQVRRQDGNRCGKNAQRRT